MDINFNNIDLISTAVNKKDWPKGEIPEIAFAGRSNVGKSSLINMISNRKKLAYVGKTPGKTRTINFYNVDDKICLVDLPGYGYAVATRNKEAEWADFVNSYFNDRKQLKLVVHLLDSRHKPTKHDIQMNNWLNYTGTDYLICLTKTDKLGISKRSECLKIIKQNLVINEKTIIVESSSLKKRGKTKLLEIINSYSHPHPSS